MKPGRLSAQTRDNERDAFAWPLFFLTVTSRIFKYRSNITAIRTCSNGTHLGISGIDSAPEIFSPLGGYSTGGTKCHGVGSHQWVCTPVYELSLLSQIARAEKRKLLEEMERIRAREVEMEKLAELQETQIESILGVKQALSAEVRCAWPDVEVSG